MEQKASFFSPETDSLNYRQLTRRNTLFTLLLFISPFILLLIFMNFSISRIIQRQAFNQLAMTVEENTKILTLFLQDREADFRSYRQAEIGSLQEGDRLYPLFEQLLRAKPWYDLFFIADQEGRIIFSTDNQLRGKSISSRPYFQASRTGAFFNSGIFPSELLGRPALVLSQPFLNRKGETIGVIGVSLNLKHFYNLLFDLRIGETSELFLVDSQGILLSPTRLGGRPLEDSGYFREKENPHRGENFIEFLGQKVI